MNRLLPATWIVISASSAQATEPGDLVLPSPPSLGQAPELPTFADDTPGPVTRPDGTVCLPPLLAKATGAWVAYARRLPELCQTGLDALAEVELAKRHAATTVARAECATAAVIRATDTARAGGRWLWMEVGAAVLGAFTVGAAVGYLAAQM